MRAKPYLLAFAAILLRSHMAYAQPDPVVQEYRVPDAELPSRPPSSGFLFGVRPGPGNAYGYPYVRELVSGSAAERAGLLVGDTIISVDGRDMRYEDFFPTKVPGTRYVMLVRRGAEELELLYIYPRDDDAPPRETPAAAAPPA